MSNKELSVRFTVGRFSASKSGYVFNVYVSTKDGVPLFTIPGWRFVKNKNDEFTVYSPAYRVGAKWFQSILFESGGEFKAMLSELARAQLKKGNISRNPEDDIDVTQEE